MTSTNPTVAIAKTIRANLRAAFPGVKFSLTGSRGTGYGWYSLAWTNGPTDDAVTAVVRATEGVEQLYGVNSSRHFSPGFTAWAQTYVADYDDEDREKYLERYRLLAATDARTIA